MSKSKTRFLEADRLISAMVNLFKASNEIDIAVMFAKQNGFRLVEGYLIEALQKNSKVRILLGKDFLLTDVEVLRKLHRLSKNYSNLVVRIYLSEKNFAFHPKFYAFRSKKSTSLILGSSNISKGGFSKNIEANIILRNKSVIKRSKLFFENLFLKTEEGGNSIDLDYSFIKDYERAHKNFKKMAKKSNYILSDFLDNIKKKTAVRIKDRKKLIKDACKFVKTQKYRDEKKRRDELIRTWRKKLDVPGFKSISQDDWHSLYSEGSLGRLRAKWRDKLWNSRGKLLRRLRCVCNDSVPIEERIDEVLNKENKLEGLEIATITKILTIHNPNKYGVSNDRVKDFMKKYGATYPRGISKGRKYRLWLDFVQQIVDKCGYMNFADVDYFIWEFSNSLSS